ncbi:site-specific integrase [Massilia sp. GER05]|uniref:site-specific integrase n=1 Tax=Massilia sp. GER05 TaxID=3394605 RepID=UPI003F82FE85
MPSALPKELGFISQFRLANQSIENAIWLDNGFDAEVWKCKFGSINTTIDFRKATKNGTLLTSPKNQHLLRSFKRFLCLQTHPLLTGSIIVSPKTARLRVGIALHVLDFFLLQDDKLDVATNGFSLVTEDDVMVFIDILTAHRSIKASIYEPTKRIVEFLSSVDVPPEEFSRIKKSSPDLFHLGSRNPDLVLPTDQILKARAWLKLNGFYTPGNHGGSAEFKYRLNRKALLKLIIGNRVLSDLKFDGIVLEGLDVSPTNRFTRELPAVPVSNIDEDERAASEFVTTYIAALKSMQLVRQHDIDLLPDHALAVLDDDELLQKERTKERSRFTTLPFEVANNALGKAIEFYLEYGEPLINYYLALAAAGGDVRELVIPIPIKLKELGITAWQLSANTSDEFFIQLKNGRSLYNMLEVLYGAIAILVNTLMARRVSELNDLTRESIVEDSGWYFLAFNLRKANVLEHRERALRPLPALGAEALKLLAKLSTSLSDLGYETNGYLFSFPFSAWHSNVSSFGTCQPDLRRCFDRFCDYYETATDDQGRRYYIRAHQLRRNFAMLFYWQGSFGGIEVLRYFLGHKKPSMTYRYVTESISGKVLRRVKATVAKEMIKAEHSATQDLAELICARYGVTLNELHILPERDVVDYIEDLIASGEAEVEPEFIDGPNGEEYRILYKVFNKSNQSSKV